MSWGDAQNNSHTKAPPVSCPVGERYAHIKIGGLPFKAASRAAALKRSLQGVKAADMNRRWRTQGLLTEPGLRRFDAELAPTYTTCTRLNGFGGASSTCYSY